MPRISVTGTKAIAQSTGKVGQHGRNRGRKQAHPLNRPTQQGFTLLELMLVILIIGLMVGTVSLTLPDSANQQLHKHASRLQAQINLAAQQSVFQNRDIGLSVTTDSYNFYSFEGDSWTLLEPQSRFSPRPLPAKPVSN